MFLLLFYLLQEQHVDPFNHVPFYKIENFASRFACDSVCRKQFKNSCPLVGKIYSFVGKFCNKCMAVPKSIKNRLSLKFSFDSKIFPGIVLEVVNIGTVIS